MMTATNPPPPTRFVHLRWPLVAEASSLRSGSMTLADAERLIAVARANGADGEALLWLYSDDRMQQPLSGVDVRWAEALEIPR